MKRSTVWVALVVLLGLGCDSEDAVEPVFDVYYGGDQRIIDEGDAMPRDLVEGYAPDSISGSDIGTPPGDVGGPDTGVFVDPEIVDEAEALWLSRKPDMYRVHLVEEGGWSWNDRVLTVSDGVVLAEELAPVGDGAVGGIRESCGTSSACCFSWEGQSGEGFIERAFRSVRCFLGNYPVLPSFDSEWGFPTYWGRDIPGMWDDEEIYRLSEFQPLADNCEFLCRGDRPCRRDDGGCVVSDEIVEGCPPHDADYAAAVEEASRCERNEDCEFVERMSVALIDCVPPALENNGYVGMVAVGSGGKELLRGLDFEERWASRGCELPLCDSLRRGYTLEARCLEGHCVLHHFGTHRGTPMSFFGGRLFDLPNNLDVEPDSRCAGVPDGTFVEEPNCLCSEGFCFVRREP